MLSRYQLLILFTLLFNQSIKSQIPYGIWQILPDYTLSFQTDTFLIEKNGIPGLDLHEAYSNIYVNGNFYIHSGSNFYKNKKKLIDNLDGHNSSSQGSFIAVNGDSTYLFIIYTHSQFFGSGLNMAIMNLSNDSFLFINKSINPKGGELVDVIVMDDTIHIFNNSSDGRLVHFGIDQNTFQLKKYKTYQIFPKDKEVWGNIAISEQLDFIAISNLKEKRLLLLKYNYSLDSICLIKEYSYSTPFYTKFTSSGKYLYVSDLANGINRISLSTFVKELISGTKRGDGGMQYYGSSLFIAHVDANYLLEIKNYENEDIHAIKLVLPEIRRQYNLPNIPRQVLNQTNANWQTHSCITISSRFLDADGMFWIPSVTTPNGDGINDAFMVVFHDSISSNISSFHIKIYNRLGELNFESNDKNFSFLQNATNPFINQYYYEMQFIYNDVKYNVNGRFATIP